MSSKPSTSEAASQGLDLNSAAIVLEQHETSVKACFCDDSGRAGESVVETLSEPPKSSFDLGEGGSSRGSVEDGSHGVQTSVMDTVAITAAIFGVEGLENRNNVSLPDNKKGMENRSNYSEIDTHADLEGEGEGSAREKVKLDAEKADLLTEGSGLADPTLEGQRPGVSMDSEPSIHVVEAEISHLQYVSGDSRDVRDLVAEDAGFVKGFVDENLNGKGESATKNLTSDEDEKLTVLPQEKDSVGGSLDVKREIKAVSVDPSVDRSLPTVLMDLGSFPGRAQSPVVESMGLKEDLSLKEKEVVCKSDPEIRVLRDSIVDTKLEAEPVRELMMQTDEQELLEIRENQTIKRGTMKPWTDATEDDQHVLYVPLQEDKARFSITDLVWGKVKSHPWWPGQIFDPSFASEMALRHQKKDHFLVAYFGDKTFAWCEESRLKPFQPHFSQMEKQSTLDSFVNAVNAAVREVSRRVELGMTCYCSADKSYVNNLKCQQVENAGIREGACSPLVDRSVIVNSFQPDRFLEYIQALAQCPMGGADRLELVRAKAELKAFYHSKGYPELPLFLFGGGLMDTDAEISLSRETISGEGIVNSTPVPSGDGKRRGRGRPPGKSKGISENGRKKKSLSELMEEKNDHHLTNGGRSLSGVRGKLRPSGRKRKVLDSDSADSGRSKKKRLDLLGDVGTKSPSSTLSRSLKVGERMRRVASKLTGSPPVAKCNGETFQNSVSKSNNKRGDVVRSSKKNRVISTDYSSPSEMMSQLCLAARDPMKGYSFLSTIVSFFSNYRKSLAYNSSLENKHVDPVPRKRGRKKKSANSELDSLEKSLPDHMQDSYWSDIVLHSSPEREPVSRGRKRKGEYQKQRRNKKTKNAEEPLLSPPLDPTLDTTQDLVVGSTNPNTKEEMATKEELEGEGPSSNTAEKIVESSPTEMILSFTEADALPSEADLVRIFSSYGPLEEAETQVLRKSSRAKVVFKSRANAEVAFSSAGKYSIFGPALVSYRLRYLSSPKASPDTSPQDKTDVSPTEAGNSEIPVQEDAGVVFDSAGNEAKDNQSSL